MNVTFAIDAGEFKEFEDGYSVLIQGFDSGAVIQITVDSQDVEVDCRFAPKVKLRR